jgi:ADP-ribosylglycohydrolase
MKISWIDISDRINHELNQCEEEGCSIAELRKEWKEIQENTSNETSLRFKAEGFYLKVEKNCSFDEEKAGEPSSWEKIAKLCPPQATAALSLSKASIENRILGGWLGRSAGCLLGKPVEKIPRNGVIELLSSNGTWPISDYITEIGIPDSMLNKFQWNRHDGKESLKENIVCMTEDDDMNYPMVNLSVVETFGREFSSDDVGQTWMNMLPVLSTFTAERVAYFNLLAGISPPLTASFRNPYREWIGAQIRADLWGWISPGKPSLAAQMAWRDAGLSHVRNGMYGEIFFAAAIALAFVRTNTLEILNDALKTIPPQSRFAAMVRDVIAIPMHGKRWDEIVELLYEKYGKYHWVHAINNSALVIAALLFSGGDFEHAVCNAVMGGWDTDCNGATVGSIVGTMLGADRLPRKWIDPLNDRIRSSLKGFDNSKLSDLARRTALLVF